MIVDTFDMRFVDDEGAPPQTRFGEIVIGPFRERFLSSLTYWAEADYERQWLEAVSQVLVLDKAALITSMTEPSTTNFIRWWVAYREEETIIFHDALFFLDEKKAPFVASETGRFIGDKVSVSDDGQPISEWFTTTAALRAFWERKQAR